MKAKIKPLNKGEKMTSEKIMIVDDNKEFLEEIQEILSLTGYETKVVSDSKRVLPHALKYKPNMILLDLRMQGLNGFQVAEKLRKCPETASIPIIAMSGYFPIEGNSKLIDMSNMEAYLKKPFGVLDLINRIEVVMKGNKEKWDDEVTQEGGEREF